MVEEGTTVPADSKAGRGPLSSALSAVVGVVVGVPRLTLLLSGTLAVGAVVVTLALLEFQTSRSDLIDPDAEFHRRWLRYSAAFPDSSDLVVVVRGRDRVSVEVTLEKLGRRVVAHEDVLRSVLYRLEGREGQRPRYFTSTDGRTGYLRAVPVLSEDAGFEGAAAAIGRMRRVIDEVLAEGRSSGEAGGRIEIGLTGIPVLESDEMVRSQQDMIRASLLAAVGVAWLMGIGFHGVRLPLVILLGLGVSLAYSFAATALTIGHLNILSVSFAVVLIGLGVDFSIHFLARYVQSRQRGTGLVEGLVESAGEVGPGIATAALTTALAFGCASLTEFRGVAELGWIAGGGIMICAVVTFVIVPAMVRLTDSRTVPVDFAVSLMGEHWRHRVSESPRVFVSVSLAVLVLAGSSLVAWHEGRFEWLVRYDDNLLNLQADDVESVKVQRRVATDPDGGALFAVSLCASLEEAERMAERMKSLPSVGRVTHLGSFLPGADANTLKQLPAALVSRYLSAQDDWLVQVVPSESIWDREPLARFVGEVRSVDPEVTGTPLQNHDAGRQIKRSYEMAALVAVGAIAVVLLVSSLVRWQALVVLSSGVLVVGVAVEMAARDQLGAFPALWATAFVLTTLLAALVLDWRAVRDTLLALLPPLAGGVVMLGAMQWLKVPLNPANLIVLPLVLGIGVDDGVHVLHDFRARRGHYVMSSSTIHGVLLTSLTSMIGFGTLMIASHRGLSSLGLVLLLGVGSCLMVALVPLPAVLRLVSEVQRPPRR
jgi:predicted exporter